MEIIEAAAFTKMTEVIYIKRDNTEIPFGFKLQGGADFSTPLSILQVSILSSLKRLQLSINLHFQVSDNSIAQRAGLRSGDAIVKINETETQWMDHARAKQEIIRTPVSLCNLSLLIQRLIIVNMF